MDDLRSAMLNFVFLIFLFQISTGSHVDKRNHVIDKGNHLLICKQEPIELGIVLDSSSSIYIKDFEKAKTFLKNFLGQFQIGSGRNSVRVSLIPYGKGIYTQHSFNLSTYSHKGDVLSAIGAIKHEAGLRTDTGHAIEYMHTVQLTPAETRDWAEKVAIVITDGNSQRKYYTRDAAAAARKSGITMFAVGIGGVRQSELLNIAGDESRVTRVSGYEDLDSIKELLAKKTCIKKEKPTTTPIPKTAIEECGEDYPADINFVFSPADMGINATMWITSFMYTMVVHHDFGTGFKYGAVTGSCPEDTGFRLDEFTNSRAIIDRLALYDRFRLPTLVQRTSKAGYITSAGGRPGVRNVAIVFIDGTRGIDEESEAIQDMLQRGIQVFIVDPYNIGIEVPGAQTIRGQRSNVAVEKLVEEICFWK